MSETTLALPDDVVAWMESSTGASVVAATRVPGGASREAWFVDVDAPATGTDTRELFLRYSPAPMPAGSAFHSLHTEAEIMTALGRAGTRVPRVLSVHPTREAVLSERVSGATWFYRIQDPDEQVRVAQDFIRQLASVHLLRPSELDIPRLGPVKSTREHAHERIAGIRARGTAPDGSVDPLLRLTTDWLEQHVPTDDGPVVLVQGDTGPGNFMYEDGRVTAVVDWELAHWGDPMDDIAWLSLRTVQDTFTHFPDRLREYEELSGIAIDPDRVWYYRVFAEATMATLRPVVLEQPVPPTAPAGRDVGNGLIYGQLHRRLWLEALAVVTGSDAAVPPVDDAGDVPDWHRLYDDILDVLQVVVPRIEDPLAAQWTKGIARAVKYLKETDRSGRAFEAVELAELARLIGDAPDLRAARASAADAASRGDVSIDEYVRVLWNTMQRDEHLMRTASGALHDRTWPPLT